MEKFDQKYWWRNIHFSLNFEYYLFYSLILQLNICFLNVTLMMHTNYPLYVNNDDKSVKSIWNEYEFFSNVTRSKEFKLHEFCILLFNKEMLEIFIAIVIHIYRNKTFLETDFSIELSNNWIYSKRLQTLEKVNFKMCFTVRLLRNLLSYF